MPCFWFLLLSMAARVGSKGNNSLAEAVCVVGGEISETGLGTGLDTELGETTGATEL
jgi:hypothetical protein